MEQTPNEEFFRKEAPRTDPEIVIPASLREMIAVHTPNVTSDEEYVDPSDAPLPSSLHRLGIEHPRYSAHQSLESLLGEVLHPSWKKRLEALRALHSTLSWKHEHALYIFCLATTDESSAVRAVAVEILGSLIHKELESTEKNRVLKSLLVALTDQEWDVRASAARALGNAGALMPIHALIRALQWEQDESVRAALVQALGTMRTKMSMRTLLSVVQEDTSWMVRAAAARGLSIAGEELAHLSLISVLRNDTDASVRSAAASALGMAGGKEVEQALFDALYDEEEVREGAALALQQLDEETRGLKLQRRKERSTPQFRMTQEGRSRVLAVEETSHDEQAICTLAKFIKDKKGYVRDLRLLDTAGGRILLMNCAYQHNGNSLQDGLLPFVEPKTVSSIEAALDEQDEVLREAIAQAIEFWEEQQWQELLIVSFALVPFPHQAQEEQFPIRVVLTSASCQEVCRNDSSVLREIETAWKDTIDEPFVCQYPHDLTNLRIWYQPLSDSIPTSKSA